MKTLRVGALLLLGTPVWAAYQYYYTDSFPAPNINTAYWTVNGTVGASGGLVSTQYNGYGGSVISRIAVQDGTSDSEVRMTFTPLAGPYGGTFTAYVRATPNASTYPAAGTFYAFQAVRTYSPTGCQANYVVLKRVANAITVLSSYAAGCHAGETIRFIAKQSSLITYVDNGAPQVLYDSDIATGLPGVGVFGQPWIGAINSVQLGPLDRIAPNTIGPIGASAFTNRVEL